MQLIDSLRTSLSKSEGKQRFEVLNDLAWEHRFATPDTTIYFATQAFELGNKLDLKSGLARPLNILGVANNYKGNRLVAYDYYSKALQLSSEQNDSAQIAHSNNNIGRLFFDQGMLGRAYENFFTAKEIFQSINDSSGVAYTLQSLGNLYKVQHNNRKAEESLVKALEIRLALGNTRDIMSAQIYLGRFYLEVSDYENATKAFERADSAGQVMQDKINLAEIKTYLAECYLNKGMIREADAISREGLMVIEQMNNVRMRPQAYHIIGQIFFEKGDFYSAKKYFTASLEVSSQIKDLASKMRAYYDLWKVSERQKNESERLINMNQYLILKDSIKDLDVARQVERLQFEIEIERKEQENKLLKAQDLIQDAVIRQQKLQNIILIVIVGFVSVFGFLLWLNNKKRKEINDQLVIQNNEIQKQREEIVAQNQKLSKRNQQLSDLNHEKDTLMSIVAHDLKSPLNRIKGVTDLMEMEGGLGEEQQMYLRLTKEATQSGLDLITDLLDVHMLEENVEPVYTSFDLSTFLLDKVRQFTPAAESKGMHLYITKVSSEEITTDADYLSRIVDNLLSNAIKFSQRGATVVVAAGSVVDEFWISVKDHGPGFSSKDKQHLYQKFKKLSARPTAGESSNRLGLAIVKTLVDRLKGKIELSTEDRKGSEFIVRIPSVKEAVAAHTTTSNQPAAGKIP